MNVGFSPMNTNSTAPFQLGATAPAPATRIMSPYQAQNAASASVPSDTSPNAAIAALVQVVMQLVELLKQFVSGSISGSQGAEPVADAPGDTGAASQEFLWKPVSEKNGNLVVLLPASFSGRVTGLTIKSADGEVLAQGKSAGLGNGGREHYRFNKSGDEFPKGSVLEVALDTGATRRYTIKEPGERTVIRHSPLSSAT